MEWVTLSCADFPRLKPMLQAVIATETYYTLLADANDEDCENYWFAGKACEVFGLEENGKIIGAFYLRPNHHGLGAHIANAGYMVDPAIRSKGIGRAMAERSIERARERKFRGIQFNFVVSTNEPAVHLWQKLGWKIIGTIPGAYHYKRERYVDSYVMFKDLTT